MKFDAFISYRRENGFLMAQVIHDRLKGKGISCFLDLEEDRSGNFNENLLNAIKSAPNFILVLPKNALTRCKDEGDWVRREILAAIQDNKTIIPVMYDGFKWPRKWSDGIPEEIRQLRFQQGVSMSQEYLSAMIDKIISYMVDLKPADNIQNKKPVQTHLSKTTAEFMSAIKSDLADIESVCMAFHAGAEWRSDPDKVELLQCILEKGIKLRVIVNSAESADVICKHMQQPLKRYVGIDRCADEWLELQKLYPETVQVRVSNLPIIHRIYLLRKADATGIVNVKYYTYGNYKPAKDFRLSFTSDDPTYALYAEEFEYLWKQAGEQ